MQGTLYVLSGPAGVGKGTIVKLLLQRDSSLTLSISCTTRAPRDGEEDGREYFFLSRAEFLEHKAKGDFLETDEHFGNLYGTPKPFVLKTLKTKSVILEIDVNGALGVKRALQEAGVTPVLIMIAPPSLEVLEERMRKRATETEETLKLRLKRAEYELGMAKEYDYTVVNDDLETATREILTIMQQSKKGDR